MFTEMAACLEGGLSLRLSSGLLKPRASHVLGKLPPPPASGEQPAFALWTRDTGAGAYSFTTSVSVAAVANEARIPAAV